MGDYIYHTYPTMMKLGRGITLPKDDLKRYEPRNTSPEFWWHQHFFTGNHQIIVISRKTDIDCTLIISNSFKFSWVFKDFLINIMTAKMATPGLLKTTVFWNKGYDVVIPVHDVTKKILSHNSNYIVDVVMWPNLVTLAFLWEKLL